MRTKNLVFSVFALLFFSSLAYAQVSGVVEDEFGPLEGATVTVNETGVSTQTDANGAFTIDAEIGQNLTVTDPNTLAEQSFPIANNVMGNLSLSSTAAVAIDDIVIGGYVKYKDDDDVRAVSKVSAEEIEQIPIASLDQLLQGRAAGLSATLNSGQPGSDALVLIRGRGSFQSEIEPLLVIDGVFSDIDNLRSINPNDIEEVEILKDAASLALYGNRGAGGVILVRTKRGKLGQESSQFTYRALYGITESPSPNFEVMNSRQLLNFQRELGTGLGNGLTDAEIDAYARQANTDWSDILFRNGVTQSHEFGYQSSGQKSTNFTSLGYFNQEGFTFGSELERFTFRQNNDFKHNRLTISTSFTANYSESNFVVDNTRGDNTGGELDNPFIVPYIGLPYMSPYNPDGSLNIWGTRLSQAFNNDGSYNNPNGFLNTPYLALNTASLNTDKEEELRIIGSVNATLGLNDYLTAGLFIGGDYTSITGTEITLPQSIRGLVTPTAESELKGSRSQFSYRDLRGNVNASLTYADTYWDKHDFSFSVFTEYNKRHIRSFGFDAFGFLSEAFDGALGGLASGTLTEGENNDNYPYIPSIIRNPLNPLDGGFESDRGLFSYFGVMNYSFDKKYNITASIRRDGSSFFPDENEWGTFWSVGGKWNLHREGFLEGSSVFSQLALRASYGTVGNQELFRPFGQFDLFSAGEGYNAAGGFAPDTAGNPNLRWEETANFNVGVDFNLWNGVLQGAVDYYDSQVDGALLTTRPTAYSSFNTVALNGGEISNKGIDVELELRLLDGQGDKPYLSVFGNFNYNQNEIESLLGGVDRLGQYDVGDFVQGFREVRWAGVNPANGRPLYYNIDGQLTEIYSDSDEVVLDKGQDPVFTGGFGTNFSWKNFSLNMFWTYAFEQYRLNGSLAVLEDPGLAGFANQHVEMLNAWSQPGDVSEIPDPSLGGLRFAAGDRYLEDTSFVRLRNITLAYNITEDVLGQNSVVKNIRMFVQGQNLLTFTKWRGFDPEQSTNSGFFDYPQPAYYSVGVDVTF